MNDISTEMGTIVRSLNDCDLVDSYRVYPNAYVNWSIVVELCLVNPDDGTTRKGVFHVDPTECHTLTPPDFDSLIRQRVFDTVCGMAMEVELEKA